MCAKITTDRSNPDTPTYSNTMNTKLKIFLEALHSKNRIRLGSG